MRLRHLVGLALASVLACTPVSSDTLRIGTNVWPGTEPFYAAEELGLFGDAPVRLVEYSSASQVLNAFRNGSIEAASLTLDEAIELSEDLADIRVILVQDSSAGADALLARPGIASIGALRGLRIGYEATALGAYMLSRALETAGLRPDDVEAVSIQADEHERAFTEGQVDAIVTFEPTRSRLLKQGAREVFSTKDIPGEIFDVLLVKQAFADRNRATVDQVLRGWFAALESQAQHPEAAYKRLAQRLRLTPAEVTDVYAGIELADADANRRMFLSTPPGLAASADRLAALMATRQLTRQRVDVLRLLDPAPIRRVLGDR